MTHDSFISKYISHPIDFDNSYGFQCIDLIKMYSKSIRGIDLGSFNGQARLANHKTFGKDFTKITFSINKNELDIKQGDIIIHDANNLNPYGHIGVVHRSGKRGYYLLEQNADTGSGDGLGNNAIRINYYKRSAKPIVSIYRKNS